jgi:hypothetical protein
MDKKASIVVEKNEQLRPLVRRKARPALRVRTGVRAGGVGPCWSPAAKK